MNTFLLRKGFKLTTQRDEISNLIPAKEMSTFLFKTKSQAKIIYIQIHNVKDFLFLHKKTPADP